MSGWNKVKCQILMILLQKRYVMSTWRDNLHTFRHPQQHVLNTNIFLLNQCFDRPTKTSAHLLVPLMWGVRGEVGAPVNLFLNGTLGPFRVQWHLKVQPWPFSCALITFMSWGRQQSQKTHHLLWNHHWGIVPAACHLGSWLPLVIPSCRYPSMWAEWAQSSNATVLFA